MPLIQTRLVEVVQPRKNWIASALVYALLLIPSLYGLKCMVTLAGALPAPRRYSNTFHFTHVHGSAAVLAGLGYVALGLFALLSTGDPPPENRRWPWRVLRGVARWGGLAGMFWFWQRASQNTQFGLQWPTIQSQADLLALGLVALCFGVVGLLSFLWAIFQREAVKRELLEHGCSPLHIWWRPAAYWGRPYAPGEAAFRVIFRDPAGHLHKAYCYAYQRLFGSPFYGSRRVRWLKDEVAESDRSSESWVFVDSEPVRPRLKPERFS